jgi:hypothetical protein
MPETTQHGRKYVEVERHDELSSGVPAPNVAQASAGAERRPDGAFAQGARTAQSKGGSAHKGETQLSHRIAGGKLAPNSARRARTLRQALANEVSATVGGGVCGVAASLFLKFASQKTAAAEEAFVRGDYEAHRKLSESARMDILYAREHAARTAVAREAMGHDNELAQRRAAFQKQLAQGGK